MRAIFAFILLVCLSTLPASAQDAGADAALLVADEVFLDGRDRLVARGSVEALYDGTRLSAGQIAYDRTTDTLSLEGPIRITDSQGNVILAEDGQLDRTLENGILRGARMVLDQQLQLASVQLQRVGGRYTQLSKVAVTSCQVCGKNALPLWQIRARRVIHDQQERQLYFDQAQFRVLDVPIFYLPRMRLPDPTLERARGFLIPQIKSNTQLGFGIKVPYFIPIGDHQDLTLTPYLSPVTRTLEARYRRAFVNGDIELNMAVSNDTLQPDEMRGYLFGEGSFNLPRDFKLTFDIETTTDESYLDEYGYSGKDRLDSALTLTRTKRNAYTSFGIIHYESLRDEENNATQPTIIGDILHEKRYFPTLLGGEARMGLATHGHYRYSDKDIVGRDVARVNADLSWRRRWTLANGIRAGVLTQAWIDHFRVRQDSGHESDVTQATPAVSVELRWPFSKTTETGARHLIEPIAQIGWVGGKRHNLPNDESTRVEFDEANLLSLSRFPAADRRERGTIAAAGIRWARYDPSGWSSALTLGRVYRTDEDTEFTRSSGLQGETSDWLIAGQIRMKNGLEIVARGLFESQNRFSKAEARASWNKDRLNLGASYVLLVTDTEEDRADALSEWSLDGSYRMNRHWTASTDVRYDLASNRLARTGLGLEYRNECIEVDFSVSRKFASSSNLEPSTDFGLTVGLKGFSTGGSGHDYRRTCSN